MSERLAQERDLFCQSFAPLAGDQIHTLILGSMPGQRSLQAQQYYAHPRNGLWPILCALITRSTPSYDIHQRLNYVDRCKLITAAGYALWDVLAQCQRPGSLDSNIARETEQANAIPSLVEAHPELKLIVCNGRTAEALYKRHIEPSVCSHITLVSLPSTSPAMARLSLQNKFERWRHALEPTLQAHSHA